MSHSLPCEVNCSILLTELPLLERPAAVKGAGFEGESCRTHKRKVLRRTNFENVPIKPQRVYQEMNKAFGPDTRYVSTIGLSQIQAAQLLHVYRPRHWINAGQAGPLGWTVPATLGVVTADPEATVVALSCRATTTSNS
jgi:tartronate-semialdehyde synthase